MFKAQEVLSEFCMGMVHLIEKLEGAQCLSLSKFTLCLGLELNIKSLLEFQNSWNTVLWATLGVQHCALKKIRVLKGVKRLGRIMKLGCKPSPCCLPRLSTGLQQLGFVSTFQEKGFHHIWMYFWTVMLWMECWGSETRRIEMDLFITWVILDPATRWKDNKKLKELSS